MHPAERLLATMFDREYAALAGRASSAICALLTALDRKGSIVLLPANTCFIVLWAVIASGYRAQLVDIDLQTGGIDPRLLASIDTHDVSVIITHHFGGIPSDIQSLMVWARAHNVFVIEDCAIAFGAKILSVPLGSFGDAAVFSFGVDKIVDFRGGGLVAVSSFDLFKEVVVLANDYAKYSRTTQHLEREWDDVYWGLHRHEGTARRLEAHYPTLFQAYQSIMKSRAQENLADRLLDLLPHIPELLQARRERESILMGTLPTDELVLPRNEYANPLWKFSFLVHHDLRDDVLAALWEMNVIHTTCWYPSLVPMANVLQPEFPQQPMPNATLWGASIINLPLDDKMTPLLAKRADVAIRNVLGIS
ncbi:MAG: DegT/DnrJ/EryC1/StrS family aminotransferase [Pleurocapsa minor GSE-CHR-MK-17-07R]|jgi:dTDP-4-amino-4,6-dideoxygalactose transaminase|nr:DegT/DnrJ/EryC1/StrS family aminotransferase [Pleurocapsa minor GSE-CHR-MK 17-07R]